MQGEDVAKSLLIFANCYPSLRGAPSSPTCGTMAPNFDQLASALRHKLIFDGRNLYGPERLAELGWTYYAIGLGGGFCAGGGVRGWCPPQALGWKTRENTGASLAVQVYYGLIGMWRAGWYQWVEFENRSLVLRAVPERAGSDRLAAVAWRRCCSLPGARFTWGCALPLLGSRAQGGEPPP